MGYLVELILPCALCVLAYFIGRRELRLYRHAKASGWDLFVYTKGRLWRRMFGVGVLAATGLTLAGVELHPSPGPVWASVYMGALLTEVVLLLVLPVFDLWETARTAKPEESRRQVDPDR